MRLFQGFLAHDDGRSAILFLSQSSCRTENHFALSREGDLSEVARNLYDMLQTLDAEGFGTLFLELPENTGAGVAIRDRMTRAAAGD